MAVVSDYNVAPVIDIFGAAAGRDLGGVASDINKIIDATRAATTTRFSICCPWAGSDDSSLLH
jgi:hypothetical protein